MILNLLLISGRIEDINLIIYSMKDNWIKIVDGQFTCRECEKTSVPETNTIEGIIEANLDDIKTELIEFPTKVIYGICPVCGMEYVFRLYEDELYLESSDLEK